MGRVTGKNTFSEALIVSGSSCELVKIACHLTTFDVFLHQESSPLEGPSNSFK